MLIVDCVPDAYPPTHPGKNLSRASPSPYYWVYIIILTHSCYLICAEGQSDFIRDRRPELFGTLTSPNVVHNSLQAEYNYPQDPNEEDGEIAFPQ